MKSKQNNCGKHGDYFSSCPCGENPFATKLHEGKKFFVVLRESFFVVLRVRDFVVTRSTRRRHEGKKILCVLVARTLLPRRHQDTNCCLSLPYSYSIPIYNFQEFLKEHRENDFFFFHIIQTN